MRFFTYINCLRVLCDKGILYRLETVLWTDEHNRSASTHDQTQIPCVLGQFEGLLRVTQELCRVVQDEIQQRIVALQDTGSLSSSHKFHANGLLQVLAQVQDRLFPALLLAIATGVIVIVLEGTLKPTCNGN